MNLIKKVSLILIIPSSVVVLIMTFFVYQAIRNTLTSSITNLQLQNGRQIMFEIDQLLHDRYLDIQLISGTVFIKNILIENIPITNENRQRFDDFLFLTGPWYDLDIVNKHGLVVYSTDGEETGEEIDESENDNIAFDAAISGKVYYSDVVMSGDEDEKVPTIIYAAPVIEKNEIVGAVIGRYSWPVILEILETSNLDRIALYNKKGLLIGSNNRDDIKNILAEKIDFFPNTDAIEIAKKDHNNKLTKYIRTETKSQGYLSYLGNDWHLIIDSQSKKIFSSVDKILIKLLISIAIFFVFIIGILIILFYYSIIKPIVFFTRAAEAVAAGNLSKKIVIKSRDEIGELAKSFNIMVAKVQQSYAILERKIKEKTVELDRSIEHLKENNKNLEDAKKSLLNVLEDVESQKEISDELTRDLEKFKLAVENASDHIVITDPDGLILYANNAVKKITGFAPDKIIGKKAGSKELWGGIMDTEFYKKMWDTIKFKKQVFSGEVTNIRKGGIKYTALASISPILNDKGEVTFFVAIERDITQEREIDKAKTEFVSLASHQLRTPLSAINWYTEMLLDGDAGKINEEQKKYLEEIKVGNQRMVDLVNALLNVSRLELGTFAVDPTKMNIVIEAKSVLSELIAPIKEKQLNIKESYDKKLPEIYADPKLIRIILQNLLTNAIKYTPAKGIIKISLTKEDDNVKIIIGDNGYGIPKSEQSKIFTKLFRADNIRKKATEGTGLGLYMVKAIVEECKGKISFQSEENKGTTFIISLPLSGMKKKEGVKELVPG